MKLNKLLTPILGLATVSTVVAPIATSCTSSDTTSHIKVSPVDEKKEENGLVQYLIILDRTDYDKNGFSVSVKLADNDKSKAVSDDFAIDSWDLDNDHLVVNVKYDTENKVEEDTIFKLNIVVKYGTSWKEAVAVKYGYEAKTTLDKWIIEYTKCYNAYPESIQKKRYAWDEITVTGYHIFQGNTLIPTTCRYINDEFHMA